MPLISREPHVCEVFALSPERFLKHYLLLKQTTIGLGRTPLHYENAFLVTAAIRVFSLFFGDAISDLSRFSMHEISILPSVLT